MENKVKHLEMIESIIERMANNSFLLKGWAITLVVALFALADKQFEQRYILITFLPIIFFWFLDSYYLYLEKKYRALYNCVRQKEDDDIDFNMDIKSIKVCYCKCLINISESLFYIPFIVLIFILMKILFII